MKDVSGTFTEDGSIIEATEVITEAGPIFSVQCHGANSSDVHVCSAGPLDGLCLVCYWPQRDGE